MQTLSEWYLEQSGGDPQGFRDRLRDGQRIGQAFFNSCTPADREKLRGTIRDPFYGGIVKTHDAIDWLVS